MDVRNIHIEPGHLWSAGILWPVVCTGLVAFRFETRRACNQLGWDDWLVLPALLCVCGLSAAMIYGVAIKAVGYPDPSFLGNYLTYQSHDFTVNRQIYWSALVVLGPALGFTKLSCLVFYRRVFRTGIKKAPEVILWILIVITIIWGISVTVAALFFCGTLSHLEWMWGTAGDYLKCHTNTYMLQQAIAISDVVTDSFLVIFPLPYIWKLHMSMTRKVGLGFVFMLGSASIVMSSVKLVCLLQSVEVTKELVQGTIDMGPGDVLTIMSYFMLLEAGFALCAICLPALSSTLNISRLQTFFRNVSKISLIWSDSRSGSSRQRKGSEAHASVHGGAAEEKDRGVYVTQDYYVTSSQV